MTGDLSKNFSTWEFACKCCNVCHVDMRLIDALQDFRNYINLPIEINSGCRCQAKNDSIPGAAKRSYHLFTATRATRAADIKVKKMLPLDVYWALQEIKPFYNGGLGLYETFVHCDIGPKRRWGRIDGKYCTVEKALWAYRNGGFGE